MTRFTRLPWTREVRSDGRQINPETEHVMRPIREVCRRLHLPCERNATGLARGYKNPKRIIHLHSRGTWDLEVYDPKAGCSIMVECKTPGQGLSDEQAAWAKTYRGCGKELIVATSVQDFLDQLANIREKRARRATADV